MAIYATQFLGFLADYIARYFWLYSSRQWVIWSRTIDKPTIDKPNISFNKVASYVLARYVPLYGHSGHGGHGGHGGHVGHVGHGGHDGLDLRLMQFVPFLYQPSSRPFGE